MYSIRWLIALPMDRAWGKREESLNTVIVALKSPSPGDMPFTVEERPEGFYLELVYFNTWFLTDTVTLFPQPIADSKQQSRMKEGAMMRWLQRIQ